MFKEITPSELTDNPFDLINKEWALLGAGSTDDCNVMTVSWGAVGIIWGNPCATVYVRQSRYTKEFIDRGELFTLSFLGDSHRDGLAICGSKSGRDCDKLAESGLTAMDTGDVAAVAESRLVLVCRKLYHLDMGLDAFDMPGLAEANYPDAEDFHTMYIGKIEKVLVRE